MELYRVQLRTTTMTMTATERASGPRGLGPHIGSESALYIFVGILITLCIAAPGIARLRDIQGRKIADYLQRANRAVVLADERVAELASLQEHQVRLVQEHVQHESSQRQQKESLQEERLRVQILQERIGVLEQSLRDHEDMAGQLREEKNTAVTEAQEARRLRSTAAETLQSLQSQVRTKEDCIKSLQQRYNSVDQEYRHLMCKFASNITTTDRVGSTDR